LINNLLYDQNKEVENPEVPESSNLESELKQRPVEPKST